MAIIAMADNGIENITAKMDGAIRMALLGEEDIVIGGIGNEFELTYSASSLSITVGTGLAEVGGRHFYCDESVQLSMPASSTRYLVAEIDLSQAAGAEGKFALVTAMTLDNLNNTGVVRDKPLWQITSSASGVSSVVDLRKVKTIASATEADVDNLQSQITALQNSLGDQADFILSADGKTLTIQIY